MTPTPDAPAQGLAITGPPNASPTIGKLAAALAKAQGNAHAESVAVTLWRPQVTYRKSRSLLGAFVSRLVFGMAECWYWNGPRTAIGYGLFAAARNSYGIPEIVAHRIAWHLFRGPIPAGVKVLHRCDVRACVNPDHLFLGTQEENVRDMVTKGRQRSVPAYGKANPMARLTEEAVAAMRAEHAAGATQRDLAKRYGVAVMTVNRAVRGLSWRKGAR